MTDPVQAAIEAAKAAAANTSHEANANMGNSLATQSQNTAVGAPVQRGPKLTSADMMAGTMAVRAWLKVNQFGLFVGDDTSFFDKIENVIIDFSRVTYNMSVKYGNPAVYEKTYDQMVSTKGKPWFQVVEHAMKMGSTGEFKSADFSVELQNELVSTKVKDKVLCEAGESLGHSLSTTSWANFGRLLQEATAKNINTDTGRVLVDVGFIARSGKGNNWGVINFTNVRPV